MSNCYSGDHIAEDHIHMVIKTCNNEEPQQKYRLGTASNRLRGVCVCAGVGGGLNMFWTQILPLSPKVKNTLPTLIYET